MNLYYHCNCLFFAPERRKKKIDNLCAIQCIERLRNVLRCNSTVMNELQSRCRVCIRVHALFALSLRVRMN